MNRSGTLLTKPISISHRRFRANMNKKRPEIYLRNRTIGGNKQGVRSGRIFRKSKISTCLGRIGCIFGKETPPPIPTGHLAQKRKNSPVIDCARSQQGQQYGGEHRNPASAPQFPGTLASASNFPGSRIRQQNSRGYPGGFPGESTGGFPAIREIPLRNRSPRIAGISRGD